jgi:hypothetical protein
MIRKEVFVSQEVLEEVKRIIRDSEARPHLRPLLYSSTHWPGAHPHTLAQA